MTGELRTRFFLTKSCLLACLLLIVFVLACSRPTEITETQVRVTNLNKSIMCPVCPGESIDQSQNDIASFMREIVFDQVESGKTDEEIKNYFVERYGPVVLMQPPNKGVGRNAWIIPPIGFLIAIIVVYMVLSIMRRKRSQIQDERLYYDLDVSLTSDERKKYIALIENEEFSRKGKIR